MENTIPVTTIQINLEKPGSTKQTGFKVAIRDAKTIEEADTLLAQALGVAQRRAAQADEFNSAQ